MAWLNIWEYYNFCPSRTRNFKRIWVSLRQRTTHVSRDNKSVVLILLILICFDFVIKMTSLISGVINFIYNIHAICRVK
jgi:hypothetical protein